MPGKNFFLNVGDKDTTELSQRIRVGTITAVSIDKATVTVDWLDKTGSRTEVPLDMPFCERGWGMIVMPRLYATVVCAMRPYDFPLIIGYLPPNFMMPEKQPLQPPNYSRWSDYRLIANLMPHDVIDGSGNRTVNNMNSGEIIIRNLIDKAKCKNCGNVYTLSEWSATYTMDIASGYRMEQCPNSNCRITIGGESIRTPAVLYQNETIVQVYKIQMGIFIYLQESGSLRIKMNDGLSATDTPDKGSLVDINLDELGNFDVKGVLALTMAGQSINFNNGSNGVARKDDGCGYLYYYPGLPSPGGGWANPPTLTYSQTQMTPVPITVPPTQEVGPIKIAQASTTVKAG